MKTYKVETNKKNELFTDHFTAWWHFAEEMTKPGLHYIKLIENEKKTDKILIECQRNKQFTK